MLNLPVYLYTPVVRVFLDLENSTKHGVDTMYHGYAKLAKGLTNTIQFNFLNGDQRPITLDSASKVFVFKMFDFVTNKEVVSRNLEILDDYVVLPASVSQTALSETIAFANTSDIVVGQGVTGTGIPANTKVIAKTNNAVTLSAKTTALVALGAQVTFQTFSSKGKTKLTLTSSDIPVSFKTGLYTYSILEQTNTELRPAYIDGASDLHGNLEIVDGVIARFIPSEELVFLQGQNDIFTSGPIATNRDGKGNNGLHSIQAYFTNFTGNLEIRGSLANSAPTSWEACTPITTASYSSQNGTIGITVNDLNNINYLMFRYTKNIGTVDKILYRS